MIAEVLTLTTGPFRQNGYIVVDDAGGAVAIDPGGESDRFLSALQASGATLNGILNTHGHFDHVGAIQDLIDATGAPFILHAGDHALLRRANLYKALFQSREAIRVPAVVSDFKEGPNPVELGRLSVSWIETPGHTDGSVCLRIGNCIFTGDTLLAKGPGRTDLPGGDPGKLELSLEILRSLPPTLQAYPGHGRSMVLSELLESGLASRESRHVPGH